MQNMVSQMIFRDMSVQCSGFSNGSSRRMLHKREVNSALMNTFEHSFEQNFCHSEGHLNVLKCKLNLMLDDVRESNIETSSYLKSSMKKKESHGSVNFNG